MVSTFIRRLLILLVCTALMVNLVLLYLAKKESQPGAQPVGDHYRISVWADTREKADRLMPCLKGKGVQAKILEDVKDEEKVGGYLVVQEFFNSDTVKPTVDYLKMKGYACKVFPIQNEKKVKVQVGEVFPNEHLAAQLVERLSKEEKVNFKTEPYSTPIKIKGYTLVVEDLDEGGAKSLAETFQKMAGQVKVEKY
ncbi:MAG: hypothetical protein M1269_12455 [Chloroflexi bacterium]|nr:hypothetical protein [Chloroflexota bacterium]